MDYHVFSVDIATHQLLGDDDMFRSHPYHIFDNCLSRSLEKHPNGMERHRSRYSAGSCPLGSILDRGQTLVPHVRLRTSAGESHLWNEGGRESSNPHPADVVYNRTCRGDFLEGLYPE